MARILIMEDDEALRTILREMLELEGHEVVEAPDGAKGMKLCREKKTDAVIADVIMPEKEGLEVVRELRRDFPHIKIIAISGGGYIGPEDYLAIAQKFGAHATLTKPFTREELLKTLNRVLRHEA